MLIDGFLPRYDARSYYHTLVNARAQSVYDAVLATNLLDSSITRALFSLRALPARWRSSRSRRPPPAITIETLLKNGAILLGDTPPRELVLGLVGKFWSLSEGNVRGLNATGFQQFEVPGYAKAAMNFSVVRQCEAQTLLATETRVQCTDDQSRRRFRWYWFVIAAFSGLIRKEMLKGIKRRAELAERAGSS